MNAARPGRSSVARLRRVIVWVIVVSFGIAAIGGIVVLLGADLGETAAKVLGTTAVVGGFSTSVLCCSSVIGRRVQAAGFVGVGTSVAATALVIWVLWYDGPYGGFWDGVLRAMGTAIVASAAFSLGCLLLLLADRRRAMVRIGLITTLGLITLDSALIVYLIWGSDTVDDQIFPRVLGITSILAALGAVVVPVLSLLLRDARVRTLPASVADRILAEAERRNLSVEALVDLLLTEPQREPLP